MLYRLDADAAAIARRFDISNAADPWAGGHVAPATFAPVVTAGREFIAGPGDGRQPGRIVPRLWGVPPPRSAGVDETRGVLSVKNPDSPFWLGNLRNPEFRCLVPATAFMEWGDGRDAAGRRIRLWFSPTDQPIFAFAGVWKDSEVASFALLTCAPNALARQAGRNAMPVILPPDPRAHELWLRAGWDRAKTLLEPYPSSFMQVSPEAQSPRSCHPEW